VTLTVEEASATYQAAMRNVGDDGGYATCSVCHTFVNPDFSRCYRCGMENPDEFKIVVPISYSEHRGQLHHALRIYKEGIEGVSSYAALRLMAILWRYLEAHEGSIAAHAGADRFDVVTTVPSSDPKRDESSTLRMVVEECTPIEDRFERLLLPTGAIAPDERKYHPDRFAAQRTISPDESVLLIDDTWTTGSRAQSAGTALRAAGASNVAVVVIGRHLQPDWRPTSDEDPTCGEIFNELPPFDWSYCLADPSSSIG
jgi:predicted amidophosphoribosyltransferase